MKSPICHLCNKDFGSEHFHARTGGDLVQFSDYKPLGEGAAGHPHGLEWFCNEHLQAARALVLNATAEALSKLTEQYGVFPPYEPKSSCDPELWVIEIGPNTAKIFSILRQATGGTPSEAQKLLASGEFKAAQGWPQHFQSWQAALEDAGAKVEIRYP